MKKSLRFSLILGVLLSFFYLFSLLSNFGVKAIDYTYEGGSVKHTYDEIDVYSFDYDYKTRFKEISGFYNGHDVKDDGNSLRNRDFYSASSIKITVNHVDKKWFLAKDNDRTTIYQYNIEKEKFDAVMRNFPNEAGSYTLDEDGIYKIEYKMEDKVEYYDYLYINTKMIKGEVTLSGNKDFNVPLYSRVTYKLKLEDAYNLNEYSYSYAFGTDVDKADELSYTVLGNMFTKEDGKSKEKEFVLLFRDSDVTVNGEKKYLFIKAERNGNKTIFHTDQSFEISKKLIASVFVLDGNGNIVTDEKVYFKKGDTIKFRIVFNAPVTFENLRFAPQIGTVGSIALEDVTEPTVIVDFEYSADLSEIDFEGVADLYTSGYDKIIVVCNGENVEVKKELKSSYFVDVTLPSLSVSGGVSENENDYAGDYIKSFSASDERLVKVEYYAKECESVIEGVCHDEFNPDEEIKEVYYAEDGVKEFALQRSLSKFGKFNKKKVAFFVRAVDSAGNVTARVIYPHNMDNVIIETEDVNAIFVEEDILDDQEPANIKGKKLLVQVPETYDVLKVSYGIDGENYYECSNVSSEYVKEGFATFNCLSVENVYLKTNFKFKLEDKYENSEVVDYYFGYSNLVEGSFVVGEYNFDVFNDKEYDAEAKNLVNSMGFDSSRFVLDVNAIQMINAALGLQNVTELTLKLVYLNDSEEIVILDSVLDSLQVPSVIEILEKLSGVEKYSACALKDNDCSIDLYLKYNYNSSYTLSGMDEAAVIAQSKLVKLSFVDNYLKYDIKNFSSNIEIGVKDNYFGLDYKILNILNSEVDLSNASITQEISFVNDKGEVSSVSSIDVNKLGKYLVREYVIVGETSTFPLNYVINVVDKVAPTIRLDNSSVIRVKLDDKLKIDDILKDVIVADNYDINLQVLYSIEPVFDSSKIGKYVISFWTVDSSGNQSEVVTRTIEVGGEESITLYLIIGGIVILSAGVMVLAVLAERKRQKRG